MENVSAAKPYNHNRERDKSQSKIAYTISEAVQASGLSRSMLYVAIGHGELRARKCGARTLILDSDLRKFLQKLPRLSKTHAKPEAAKLPVSASRRAVNE
jgi:hypothetical protein